MKAWLPCVRALRWNMAYIIAFNVTLLELAFILPKTFLDLYFDIL